VLDALNILTKGETKESVEKRESWMGFDGGKGVKQILLDIYW
jgi:hypothetical protein